MELDFEEKDMLNYFCFRLIHDFNSNRYSMPNIHFAFNDQDYASIMDYLNSLKEQGKAVWLGLKTHLPERNVILSEINDTISLMESEHKKYETYNSIEELEKNNLEPDEIFIPIHNYKDFFNLLNQIISSFESHSDENNFNATGLLHSLWLRMSPSDIEDVESFLKRQVAFTKNDFLFSTSDTPLEQIDKIYISYLNHGNEDWFETNRHIRIFLKRKYGEIEGIFPDEKVNLYKYYHLPVIHYGLIKEGDEPTCYIYGIQYLNKAMDENDIVVKNIIQEERKRLRNKYVSPDFIIALKIFIDILKSKQVTTIKVPLLEVFNYDFHKNMGEKYKSKMDSYSPKRLHDLEWMNAPDYAIEEYESIKKQYERYYKKEDTISANKTERLLHTFYEVASQYDSLSITTEPFVEGDTLICKITEIPEKTL